MSWDEAQREAKHWIDGLNLQNVTGTVVDLRLQSHGLSFRGHFRQMVFKATKRLLKARGASVILPED